VGSVDSTTPSVPVMNGMPSASIAHTLLRPEDGR
jgi:hypothetical protein